jgi:hypothetical protein
VRTHHSSVQERGGTVRGLCPCPSGAVQCKCSAMQNDCVHCSMVRTNTTPGWFLWFRGQFQSLAMRVLIEVLQAHNRLLQQDCRGKRGTCRAPHVHALQGPWEHHMLLHKTASHVLLCSWCCCAGDHPIAGDRLKRYLAIGASLATARAHKVGPVIQDCMYAGFKGGGCGAYVGSASG